MACSVERGSAGVREPVPPPDTQPGLRTSGHPFDDSPEDQRIVKSQATG